MKKSLLSIMFFLFIKIVHAQLNLYPAPVTEIPYNWTPQFHDRTLIIDSTIYTGRQYCMQTKNVISGATQYHWKNHSPFYSIYPDGHHNYVVKTDNEILAYDSTTDEYMNIVPDPSPLGHVTGAGVSPNGNIWGIGYDSIGIYNGSSWQYYNFSGYGNILVINDTSAYISGYPFQRFHNGIYDSLFVMPNGTMFNDWDKDTLGNLWIAGENKLLYVQNQTVTAFDSTTIPIGQDKFKKVVVGKNGHVWICGNHQNLLEFDGANWLVHPLPSNLIIDNFNLDSSDHPWVIAGSNYNAVSYRYIYMSIYIWNGNSFNAPVEFPYYPYRNLKTMSDQMIATDEALFNYSSNDAFSYNQVFSTPDNPEVLELNCIANYRNYSGMQNIYGTNEGVFYPYGHPQGLDSTILPNDTINSIYIDNGSWYVATNSGLLIYNGIIATVFDTSNSPLPSNKITYVSIDNHSPTGKLYVGTDQGLGIYSNNQWTVYDTAVLGAGSFYVTSVFPSPYDTLIYVTTMGNGLLELYPSGGSQILNTQNGNFADDSLFYVSELELAKCGEFIIVGTKHHGVGLLDMWMGGNFQFTDSLSGVHFTESRATVYDWNTGNFIIATDQALFMASPCGGISQQDMPNELTIYPNPSNGVFRLDAHFAGNIEVFDVMGKKVFADFIGNESVNIDLSTKAKGMYFIIATDQNGKTMNGKIIIH
jgi:hypothetical protein